MVFLFYLEYLVEMTCQCSRAQSRRQLWDFAEEKAVVPQKERHRKTRDSHRHVQVSNPKESFEDLFHSTCSGSFDTLVTRGEWRLQKRSPGACEERPLAVFYLVFPMDVSGVSFEFDDKATWGFFSSCRRPKRPAGSQREWARRVSIGFDGYLDSGTSIHMSTTGFSMCPKSLDNNNRVKGEWAKICQQLVSVCAPKFGDCGGEDKQNMSCQLLVSVCGPKTWRSAKLFEFVRTNKEHTYVNYTAFSCSAFKPWKQTTIL